MKTKRKIDYVYVLDIDGNPLMPTKRFRKVRLMLKHEQAKVVRRDVFTIQLLYKPKTHYVQCMTLGCDTGYEHIGLSASNQNAEYYAEETMIDNGMVKHLETRASYRRDRRNRKTRYRQSRFDNRTAAKKKGWLPPSVKHRRDTHLSRINFIFSILPIKKVIVETTAFDVQKIKNPDIQGVEYQQGETLDFENKRHYILCRDGFKCQHCGSKEHLEVHHIIYRSQGGISRSNIAHKYLKNSQFKKDDFVLYNGMKCFISGSTNGYAVLKDINGNKMVKNSVTVKKLKFIRMPSGQFLTDIVYDK